MGKFHLHEDDYDRSKKKQKPRQQAAVVKPRDQKVYEESSDGKKERKQ